MKLSNHQQSLSYIGFIICIGLFVYLFVRIHTLSSRVEALNTNVISLTTTLSSTTLALQNAIKQSNSTLSNVITIQKQNVGALQEQLGTFQNQVGNISGTVSTLQKLAKTDPELLKKYSKVYFLNENYVPAHLAEIPPAYEYNEDKQLLLHADVMPFMQSLIKDAGSNNIKIYASSAYRSFAEQKALKGDYRMTYGAGTANSFSADQGYSEHQLGTAIDFITNGLGGSLDGFNKTPAYNWMIANAFRYGFILSYPKDNGYYVFEPWHWRFVGVKLATYLHDQGKNFYDLDQKVIDEYLVSVFD